MKITRLKIHDAIELSTQYPSDFTIQYPPRREYYKERYRTPNEPKYLHEVIDESTILNNKNNKSLSEYEKTLLLYFHMPFCEHKCFYCNFAVDTRNNQNQLHDIYVDKMIQGTNKITKLFQENKNLKITGMDIGGGTPTILENKNLEKFLLALKPIKEKCSHSFPLSIETTPAIASKFIDRLQVLKDGGIDRVSMGMQSTDDELLKTMNRSKEATLSSKAIKNIQEIGFDRFSVDIIFGLPNQKFEHWQNDIQRIVDQKIEIVTTYDCLYRGKGRAMTKRNSSIPPPEMYGKFYDYGYDFLTKNGFYAPYGSVNFSRYKGETGTSAYFEGRLLDGFQFLGLGNYSSSFYNDKWWFAPYSVDQWMHDIDQFPTIHDNTDNHLHSSLYELSSFFPLGDCYTLPLLERAAKYLLFSLSFGIIDPKRFYNIFQIDIHDIYHDSLHFAMKSNWLWFDENEKCYFIVPGQFKYMPNIRSLFYSTDAVMWLKEVHDNPQIQYRHRKQKINTENLQTIQANA